MDLGSIFLIVALLALVAAFLARPFFEDGAQGVSAAEHDLSALLAEREQLLDALLELDFDNTLGKIPDGIYTEQRELLVQRSARVLRQLDDLLPAGQAASAKAADPLEALIAQRREQRKPAAGPTKTTKTKAGFCPACGERVKAGDKFCVACGAPQAVS